MNETKEQFSSKEEQPFNYDEMRGVTHETRHQ